MTEREAVRGPESRPRLDLAAIRAAVGRNIRRLRLRRSYTMDQLSCLAGLHLTFIGHIELGTKSASIRTLVAIARALKVPASALLRGIR